MERFSWLLGFRSVRQHAKRNLIAGGAIAIGLTAALFTFGYSTRINSYMGTAAMYLQQPGHVAIIKKGGLRYRLIEPDKFSLDEKDLKAIEAFALANPSIEIVAPYLFGAGLIGSGCKSFPFRAHAYSLTQEKRVKNHPELKEVIPEYKSTTAGVPLWESNLSSPIGLSRGLAKRLGKTAQGVARTSSEIFSAADCDRPDVQAKLAHDPNLQLLTQDFDNRLNAVDSNMANEFSTGMVLTENGSLQMDILQLQDLLRTSKVSYVGLFLKDRGESAAMAQNITSSLQEKGLDVEAYAWDDERWNPNYFASFNVMVVTEIFISIVVAAVVLLSILNTVNIGLVEARQEIGTLRALGYKPSQVAWIFAIESFCVATLAVVVGSIFSVLFFAWIKSLGLPLRFPGASQSSTFQVTPPLWSYGASAVFLCLMVVVTSLIIARRYASQPTLTLLDRGN
ncbi:MAG: FtsX-like permease family protein [Proteobacteria bacterium]|nr:MAG: FtsX-like permease family protein [Pseudomonadota bacterium]